ncbi:MAG: VIT and VWA domain-containing protein [Desulfatitalea sp.]
MRSKMTAAILEPVGEGKIALQAVNVEAHLENLLCEVSIKQVYSNLEKINIEAVYTFPLPLGAVLLAMTIKTKTKELKGVVIEKTEAEQRYEEAITDGDTAIMLEQVEPGLYSMNVGNLQPEETIEISMTYSELLKWRDNSLRFYLPTTVAPRYGDTESAGIQPHQAPEYDLTAENNFSIILAIHGTLAGASIESPSHKIAFKKQNDLATVSLQKGQALMDRDFILNIAMPGEEKNFGHLEDNADGYTALASFYPRFPSSSKKTPRCVTIIVDCSGSMGGDSMAQARSALNEILDLLRPEDQFNVVRFGSSYKMLFAKPVPVDKGHLKKAKDLLETMDADMGGTEIGNAVAAAIKSKMPKEMSREVLLITDGEVWNWEKITAEAADSGFRFFTVGVGSSVSEAFVQTLAEATGGACELVTPNEGMVGKIVRHFKRIYFPKAGNVRIIWPGEPDQMIPGSISSVFDGDTLHVFGRFKTRPTGDVLLQAELEDGKTFTQKLRLQSKAVSKSEAAIWGTTTRMAVALAIRNMADAKRIAALGVEYQLMTRCTNYLAIDVRESDDKAKDLPALRKTPQILAAGWGGSGAILQKIRASQPSAAAPIFSRHLAGFVHEMILQSEDFHSPETRLIGDLIAKLNWNFSSTPPVFWSLDELLGQGFPEDAIRRLEGLRDSGIDEHAIVVAFVYLLAQEKKIGAKLSRTSRRVVAKAFKQLPVVMDDVLSRIREVVQMLQ